MCVFQNYTRLTASYPGQAGTRKEKASLDLNKARDDGILGWQWHQLDHMQTICTSLQTDNHASTLSLIFTGWTLFLTPNQQCQNTGDIVFQNRKHYWHCNNQEDESTKLHQYCNDKVYDK